ncbi:HelD family protein [Embleya scabrispora]|uniref:HelD family protein n=1 Tax=Embleya scabrispora TaxID=159449 RepID=UPI0019148173|nr:AAA family ATPase [Embleya scabrispora]
MGTNSRDAVIAVEQKAVDHAYACYERQLRQLTEQSPASASASGKDSIVTKADADRKAAAYGGLAGEALVISRVDVHDPGEPHPETWYVGRRTVADPETGDRLVVSWTTPLAVKWHNARPETPGELLLRRQLRCVERTVEDYFDEISRDSPLAVGVRDGEPVIGPDEVPVPPTITDEPAVDDGPAPRFVPSPRDVSGRLRRKPTQVDEFLLRELHRSRSGRMRDIVETIRRDQMALVTGSPTGVLVVQGGPGTGKSAVGLHRVTWLVNNDHFRAQDILVVGPHQGFLDYVGRVLPTLGTRNVTSVQLARLWAGDIRGTDSAATRLVKSDDRMVTVLRRRVDSERRPGALDALFTAPSDDRDEAAFMVTIGSTSLRLPRSEVLALLHASDEAGGAYRVRRDRFRHVLVDRLLNALTEVAPRRGREATVRRDLERNRHVVTLVERAWPTLSPEEALRSLFDSADRLRECASGILDEAEQAALRRPRAKSAAEEAWTLDDLVCLEELRLLIAGETPRHYRHIVVDEAQDLTPMQARSLRLRCPTGSMTVLGDLAQATGPHSYEDWDRLGALLTDRGEWRATELDISYRVPAQIMEFVAPLARAMAPSLTYPTAVRRAEGEPVSLMPTDSDEVPDAVLARVRRLNGTDGTSPRSIAVVVPDDSRWSAEIEATLDREDALTPEQRATVSVLVASRTKGMEFDHVIALDPAAIVNGESAGARKLYVVLTRSTQSLTILHTSPLPEVLTGGGHPGEVVAAGDAQTAPDTAEAVTPSAPDTSQSPSEPAIGDRIRVRVVAGKGSYRKVQAIHPATTHPLYLFVRHGAPPPPIGADLDCWVVRVEARRSLVSASEHGRKPISPGMAQRYVAALGVLSELAQNEGEFPPDAASRLAELRGMANRCLRRDQSDWLIVWRLLGSPDTERLTVLRDLAQRTRDAIGRGAPDLSTELRSDPASTDWADALSAARAALRARPDEEVGVDTPLDLEPRTPEPRTESAAKDIESHHDQHIPHPPQATVNPMLLDELAIASEADRNCNTHEAVRHELKAALLRAGLRPSDSPTVDVSRDGGDGHFVYEVLGAGCSAYPDLRAGAARLLEIDHTSPRKADRLYLVLSEPPAQDWAADTVRGVFGIHLLWRTPSGWDGPDIARALGVGGAAAPQDS